MKDTARIFHVSIPTVSQDLELAEAIEKFPELAREPTRAAALRRLRKMKDGSELPPTVIEAIEKRVDFAYTHGSVYSWLDRLEPNSFDLLLTDATEEADYDRLIKALNRTLTAAAQGFLFFNTENAFPVIQAFRQEGFRVSNSPHILVQRGDVEAYINFIWVSKHIAEPPAEIKKAETWKTDPNRVHHLDRPLLFLQKIIKAVNATNILDPFAYGGSTFIAAENCDVKCRCFVENEAIYKGGRARLVKFLTPSMRREVSEGEVEEMKKENDNVDMQS